jgi:tRNA 5-methylaminomethyl-2-thiouridine biosynthesis bifunctional protein
VLARTQRRATFPRVLEKASKLANASKHCVIIGAGIAGACVAHSLARRGWQVTVLDAAAKPASAASGLPAGLYAPFVSADNNFSSQITDIGAEYTHQLAKSLLIENVDWQPSGVMSRKFGESEQWHARAGWIKPTALVNACLAQTGITWRGNVEVRRLVHGNECWTLFDCDDKVLMRADIVVIAASNQSVDLINTIPTLPKLTFQAVRGQVTFGSLSKLETQKKQPYPINGNGSYLETDTEWLVGATYDRDNCSLENSIHDQAENFERLENLAPDMAARLKPAFERGLVKNWVGIRCATSDRLPVVGEITPGIWLCTAMASRGLTFAPLCAELLAAQLHDEQLPLSPRLVKALGVQRFIK